METYLKKISDSEKASAIPKYPKKYVLQGNYVLVFQKYLGKLTIWT